MSEMNQFERLSDLRAESTTVSRSRRIGMMITGVLFGETMGVFTLSGANIAREGMTAGNTAMVVIGMASALLTVVNGAMHSSYIPADIARETEIARLTTELAAQSPNPDQVQAVIPQPYS